MDQKPLPLKFWLAFAACVWCGFGLAFAVMHEPPQMPVRIVHQAR